MATQGLISIVDKDNKTLYKIVVGCEGFNLPAVVDDILTKPDLVFSLESLYDIVTEFCNLSKKKQEKYLVIS